MLRCEILSTGDEVLTGMITDTNASFLADRLGALGFEVVRHTTVGDDRAMLRAAFRELGDRADAVLCTGGLGPTVDDLTTEVAAEITGSPLKLDEPSLAHMEALFRSRSRPMPENNKKQVMIPEPADLLQNPIGTAPGFTMVIGRARFFFMPGVPREMKKMFEEQVVPRLDAMRPEPTVFDVRVHRSFGLTESATDQMLHGIEDQFPGVKLGFRAHFPEIQIKLTAKGENVEAARGALDRASAEVKARIGAHVFSDGAAMEEVIGALLREAKATLASAESCTGGMVGEMVTRVPGSSEYFDRGFITYSNRAKIELLGVPEAVLAEHGAVSEPTARAMAEGAKARSNTTYALSITGVAGPGGGTPEKPVGLVFIALAAPDKTVVRKVRWPGGRDQVRQLSAMVALDMLRRSLLGLSVE